MSWKKSCENCEHNQVCSAWILEKGDVVVCDEWVGWLPANKIPKTSDPVIVKYNFGTNEKPDFILQVSEYHYTADESEKGFGKNNSKAVAWHEIPKDGNK